jgi:hypothetical protein
VSFFFSQTIAVPSVGWEAGKQSTLSPDGNFRA